MATRFVGEKNTSVLSNLGSNVAPTFVTQYKYLLEIPRMDADCRV
jgi:hypothetical protein